MEVNKSYEFSLRRRRRRRLSRIRRLRLFRFTI